MNEMPRIPGSETTQVTFIGFPRFQDFIEFLTFQVEFKLKTMLTYHI